MVVGLFNEPFLKVYCTQDDAVTIAPPQKQGTSPKVYI